MIETDAHIEINMNIQKQKLYIKKNQKNNIPPNKIHFMIPSLAQTQMYR